mgnify:CR=1 FL=1
MDVKFPPYLTIRTARSLVNKCEEALGSRQRDVNFDLSISVFSDPFAVTLLAGAIKACVKKGHRVQFVKPNVKKLDEWFDSIGFYAFGGADPGSAKYSERQVELRRFSNLDPTYTEQVLGVLCNDIRMSERVRDSLRMSVNEMLTNAFDHSQSPEGCLISA